MGNLKNIAAVCVFSNFFFVGSVIAAPEVTAIQGNIFDSPKIVVSGRNFGEFGGRIIAWDDFEQHPAGTFVNGLDAQIGESWSTQYGYTGSAIAVDDRRAVSGKKSVKIEWGADGGYSIRAFGWSGKGPIEKIYISYERFMQGNYSSSNSDNHKQFYLFGDNSEFPQFMPLIPGGENSWAVYNNSGKASSRLNGERGYSSAGWNYDNTKERFQRWEWYLKLNEPYTEFNGIVNGWVDGKKSWDFSDYRFAYNSGKFDDFRLGHMAQGFFSSAIAWFDDVYTATTPARAEVCYSELWANCGSEKTLLVPVPSAWSDSRVEVESRAGSLSASNDLFLYLVDSEGRVNSKGFPLSGSSAIIEDSPPNAPDLDIIN